MLRFIPPVRIRLFEAVALFCAAMALIGGTESARADGSPEAGATAFVACTDCHDLRPGHNMTGPSLSKVFGAKAASKSDFARYSDALKGSHLTWDAGTLDAWLADSKALLPGSRMNATVGDAKTRADIIAYLAATQRADGKNQNVVLPAPAHSSLNLKDARPSRLVASMQLCKDTYTVVMQSGASLKVWERDLRIKTDSSDEGPAKGAPAFIQGGMHGDRPYVVFSAPAEISGFVKAECAAATK